MPYNQLYTFFSFIYHIFSFDPDLHEYFFPSLPSVCLSTRGNVVRDPALRRRVRVPADPLFASSGSVGGFGKALNGSSASQGTGNFGFWYHANKLVAYDGVNEQELESTSGTTRVHKEIPLIWLLIYSYFLISYINIIIPFIKTR